MNTIKHFFKIILLGGDIAVMYLSVILTLIVRHFDFNALYKVNLEAHFITYSFLFIVWLLVLFFFDFYEIPLLKNKIEFFSNLLFFSVIAFLIGGVYFYFQSSITPKTVLLINIVILVFLLFLWRLVFLYFLKLIRYRGKIIIIGFKPELKEITAKILAKNKFCLVSHLPAGQIDFSLLQQIIKTEKPDLVVLAVDFLKENGLAKSIFTNLPLGLNYIDFKQFYEDLFKKVPIDSIDETWFLENFKNRSHVHRISVRLFDVIFAIFGCVITLLFFPFIALGIKLNSPGPIIYKQKRIGKNNKSFYLYKFRTMKQDAESNGVQWAIKDDSRRTFFGRVLRATHLDEFPQFFNILIGNLSLVGPRPERPEFVERLKARISFYNTRHVIKPGLTGWAQIKYRYAASDMETKEKLKYDLYYLKHKTLLLNFGIILKTISSTFREVLDKVFTKQKNILEKIIRSGKEKRLGLN